MASPRTLHLPHSSLLVFRRPDLALCAPTVPAPPQFGPLVVAPFLWPGDSPGNTSTFSKLDVFSATLLSNPGGGLSKPSHVPCQLCLLMACARSLCFPPIRHTLQRFLDSVFSTHCSHENASQGQQQGLLGLSLSLKSCLTCSLGQLQAKYPAFYLLLIALPKLYPRKRCSYALCLLQRPCKTILV